MPTMQKSIMTELVLPNDANLLGNLLGGRMLHFIDISGALAATRFSGGIVATKTIDAVNFNYPVKVGDIVEFTSYVTWVGNTSIETAVEIYMEDAAATGRRFINKVYLVFVALDKYGKKRPIPHFEPESEEERIEFEQGHARQAKRLKERV